MSERDSVDGFLEAALRRFPALDPEVEAAVDRISKLAKYLDRQWEATAERFGLSKGEYKVLLALWHAPEESRTPGELADQLLLSTGAMTNRLDRLEEAGLVRRSRDPHDRRSVIVTLTERGSAALVEGVEAQAEEEQRIVGVLRPEEQRKLNALLRRLMIAFERDGRAGH